MEKMREVGDTGTEVYALKYWNKLYETSSTYCHYNSLDALVYDFDSFVKNVLEKDDIILTDEEIEKYKEALGKAPYVNLINIEGTDYHIWVDYIQLWGFV